MNSTLDSLIADVDEHYSIAGCYPTIMNYLIDCLQLVREQIPGPVADCFLIAEAHWGGEMNKGELDKARIKCWRYLDELEADASGEEESIYVVRALVCALFSEPGTEDTHELLHWFLSHVGQVKEVDDSLVVMARRHFPEIA